MTGPRLELRADRGRANVRLLSTRPTRSLSEPPPSSGQQTSSQQPRLGVRQPVSATNRPTPTRFAFVKLAIGSTSLMGAHSTIQALTPPGQRIALQFPMSSAALVSRTILYRWADQDGAWWAGQVTSVSATPSGYTVNVKYADGSRYAHDLSEGSFVSNETSRVGSWTVLENAMDEPPEHVRVCLTGKNHFTHAVC